MASNALLITSATKNVQEGEGCGQVKPLVVSHEVFVQSGGMIDPKVMLCGCVEYFTRFCSGSVFHRV